MANRCYIIPPHLLRAIAENEQNPEPARKSAEAALLSRDRVVTQRKERIASVLQTRRAARTVRSQPFVPAQVLRNLSEAESVDEEARERAKQDAAHVESLAERKVGLQTALTQEAEKKAAPQRAVYDANHTFEEGDLPGKLVRGDGAAPVEDKAVNDAYDNVGVVLEFYKEKFQWNSLDNNNMDVVSSVHFGQGYENAFWDPEIRQMVYGDGGQFLGNFTGCIDVIGHEMTHAITEHTSPLDYQGQPGALNEHVSDAFGIMIKQKVQNEKSDEADWLIGEDCILPGVKGVALRSMKAPGTAYDDPRFGKDPQPDNMSGFKDMVEDNGGVHIFSGIPNRAFYLASVAFGGYSWEKTGQIWWKTMRSGKIPERCTFLQFADATVDTAKDEFDEETAKIVRKAWNDVGVTRGI